MLPILHAIVSPDVEVDIDLIENVREIKENNII